jgi:hypothetical protein
MSAPRAQLGVLTRSATREVVADVDGVPMSFVIRKLKAGDRRRLQDESIDENGILDLDHAARLACELCVVEPALSAEDIALIDVDVFLQLSQHISDLTGLTSMVQAVTPDPQEGADVVKSFPASRPERGVAVGVDEAADHAGARVDA